MKLLAAFMRVWVFGLALAPSIAASAQQVYPNKPIRFIVPFPPGGSTDPMARMAGAKLAERLGQPVVVDNRPGASGIVGTEVVAKAPRDGYMILLGSSPFSINPALGARLPYDPIKDFAPIATIAKSRQILVVHPSIPANTLGEFIALAKSRPGKLNYATSGTGNLNHLGGELFNMMANVKLMHIPYKGAGPAIADVLGGQIEVTFQVPISVLPHIASGRLKSIAITGSTRLAMLPQVPTFTEAGLPGYELSGWTGILAPAGTSQFVIERIAREMKWILGLPVINEHLIGQGMEPFVSTPDEFAAKIRADIDKFRNIGHRANIKSLY